MNKCEYRKLIKCRIEQMDVREKLNAEKAVFKNLMELDEFSDPKFVFSYFSTPKELGTVIFNNEMLSRADKLMLLLPQVILEEMEFCPVTDKTRYMLNKWGIFEPVSDNYFDTQVLSEYDEKQIIYLMPMLGFSKNFERLGKGGGFYDRFLEDKPGIKIAVGFDCQEIKSGFSQSFDIKPDIIVTPSKVLRRE